MTLQRLIHGVACLAIASMLAACGAGSGAESNLAATGGPSVATPPPAQLRPPLPGPEILEEGRACGGVPLPKARETLEFCFSDPANQARSSKSTVKIIYYLHGLNGSVKEMFEGRMKVVFDTLGRILGSNTPIFVGISIGSQGVFADDTREILVTGLPALEANVAPGKKIERVLLGGSMGGYNSLRLAGENARAFSKVAALCPAVATFNGHRPQEVAAYIERHRDVLDRPFFDSALATYKRRIPTEQAWVANNPLTFLDRGAYAGLPIFMSIGDRDSLALFEGTREFRRRAEARGDTSVDYHEVSGGHCMFDFAALLRFL